ncbi:hypothetical protein GCM10009127_08390 [Alteraurantiacibacter aestuarii]|uniref:NACHT domain-containing protein n=1 Tax=Alteraurantiacibacter aestuarii TaxID=650004 RepID=A0A844ZJN2_9SPHN|nr:hypothetical protein [Alteraurantiacibacter aestuarii]MXO87230.1 hypothetical protein [Alteraurantiacibacter aestuarii]
MKAYDRSGVDLLSLTSDDEIECAVQCKGFFKVEGLADDQFDPIAKSIKKFRDSGLETKTYVLVHNQDGRNRDVAEKIDQLLADLVASGRADRALQWDRHKLFSALQDALWKMIEERISQQADFMIRQAGMNFSQPADIVSKVPIQLSSLHLIRGSRARIVDVDETSTESDLAGMLDRGGDRWAVLTGLFGSGKSTSCLNIARHAPSRVIYVPAADIEPEKGGVGTHVLMQDILKALSIFADFDEDEKGIFERLASAMLRKELSANDSSATLIIDGLDENRSLAGPSEITRFASALAELRCRILLSTRSEHFNASFGNYDHLFNELSMKGVPKRIPVLHLAPWGWQQIIALVEQVSIQDPENQNFSVFLEAVRQRQSGGWDAEFLRHPLFLRMTLDLIGEGMHPAKNSSELISLWTDQKLIRDLKAARETPVPITDRDEFLHSIRNLMAEAAGLMVDTDDSGRIQLAETIDSGEVVSIAQRIFNTARVSLHSIASTSLIVPVAVRYRMSVPMRFSHRAFQEYFLAEYLQGKGLDGDEYPLAVQEYLKGL